MIWKKCVTELENETLGESVMFEVLLACGYVLTGFLVHRMSKFHILCEYKNENRLIWNSKWFHFGGSIVGVLAVTGTSAVSCMLTNIPMLQVTFFVVLLTCNICPSIVNAAIVQIYPTNLRLKRIIAISLESKLWTHIFTQGSCEIHTFFTLF